MVTLTVTCTLLSSEEEDIEDFQHIMSYQNQTVKKNIKFVTSLCIAMETNDDHIWLLFFQVIKDFMVQSKSFFYLSEI